MTSAGAEAPAEFLAPMGDEVSEGFWDGTAAGELRIQVCNACGRLRHPPRVMCPHCQSTDRGWQPVSGRGTVWSYVISHPPLLPAYAAFAPYAVITVALEEEPTIRMVGNLVTTPGGAINEVDPHSVVIGEPVRVVFASRRRPDGTEVFVPEWVRDPR